MNRLSTWLCSMVLLLAAGRAVAADTVETWDEGAADLEAYGGLDGMGPAAERSAFGDLVLGYGIVDRFGAWLGLGLEATDEFRTGSAQPSVGLIGNPLDTRHVDVDMWLEGRFAGKLEGMALSWTLELNLDLEDEQRLAGLYLRPGLSVHGIAAIQDDTSPHESTAGASLDLNPGLYVTLVDGHQLLAEIDMAYHEAAAQDGHRGELGGLAFGYNATVSPYVELIHQLYLDLPQHDEVWAVGWMLGIVGTLPILEPARNDEVAMR